MLFFKFEINYSQMAVIPYICMVYTKQTKMDSDIDIMGYDRPSLTLPEPTVKVAITHGDINGVGYEVILKSLENPEILKFFIPIIYGSSKIAAFHRKSLSIDDLPFNHLKHATQAVPHKVNILNLTDQDIKVEYGKLTQIGGELAYQSLEKATDDLMEGQVDVLVTGPISKENIQSDNFHFAGHTEYLTEKFGATGSLMLMVCDNLRVGLVTNHLPLNIIADTISVDRILSKIKLLHQSLLVDFGIPSPKIAVLSLNPHAGDGGLMGTEEAKIITPAIQKAYAEGIHAFGPYPSDGFFGTGNYAKFDGILAMYHDQGLIPFKVLSQGRGVNFTAGLPFVRTSPAHGTAFDLAGKDQAGFESMQQAILLAVKIFKNRIEWEEMTRNPLKIQEPLAQDFE